MYATHYVFSKGFFVGWIVVVFLWAFLASSTITLIPIWEGRAAISSVTRSILGRKKGAKQAEPETLYGVSAESARTPASEKEEKTVEVKR